jgi:hypothetical protein
MVSNETIVYCAYGVLGLMGIVTLFVPYLFTHDIFNSPKKHNSPSYNDGKD